MGKKKAYVQGGEPPRKSRLSRIARSIKITLHRATGYKSRSDLSNAVQNQAALEVFDLRGGVACILATPHVTHVARLIVRELEVYGIRSSIIFGKPSGGYLKVPHIVVCPQIFDELPECYVAFQMEQSVSDRWFDERYLGILSKAHSVLDYSLRNIEFLHSKGVSRKQTYYVPIGRMDGASYSVGAVSKDIDVLFYGDAACPRRQVALDRLREHYSVVVVNNVFGEDLYKIIGRAKLVVNIHYYEGALLETTRINECMSLGALVVSEEAVDQVDHQANLEGLVDFFPIGDWSALCERVGHWLGSDDLRGSVSDRLASGFVDGRDWFVYYFGRFLLATDNICFDDFYARAGGCVEFRSDKVCLGLPEYGERKRSFEDEGVDEFQYFPGLRHQIGWVGCGLSYKFIAKRALDIGMRMVTVCEDDVEFKADWRARYEKAMDYILEQDGGCDVFSGLIADLHSDVSVRGVVLRGTERYVHLDKMVSMVFNVYGIRLLELLSSWDSLNRDVHVNAVDRYVEAHDGIRVVTTDPFIFGHKEDLDSVLWGKNNTIYRDSIMKSQGLLEGKIDEYLGGADKSRGPAVGGDACKLE